MTRARKRVFIFLGSIAVVGKIFYDFVNFGMASVKYTLIVRAGTHDVGKDQQGVARYSTLITV
jgi:hypothetical protein